MIKVVKGLPPASLLRLEARCLSKGLNPDQSYKKMNRTTRDDVKKSLLAEQGHLCVYCMCRISLIDPDRMCIEHLIPRNPMDGRDVGQGLDYQNLYAVCHGNEDNDVNSGYDRLTCDKHKNNQELKRINPSDETTLDSIFYKLTGEICSNDEAVNGDLNDILNLNSHKSSLITERKKTLNPILQDLGGYDDISALIARCHELLDVYENEVDPKTPYVGIIIWYLKSIID